MDILYKTLLLPNGLTVRFENHSCRYFGDYHHVMLDVISDIPVPETSELRKSLGPSVMFKRRLSKMAVPSARVSNVLDELLTSFQRTTLHYMSGPSFIEKYIRSQADRAPVRLRCLSTKRIV